MAAANRVEQPVSRRRKPPARRCAAHASAGTGRLARSAAQPGDHPRPRLARASAALRRCIQLDLAQPVRILDERSRLSRVSSGQPRTCHHGPGYRLGLVGIIDCQRDMPVRCPELVFRRPGYASTRAPPVRLVLVANEGRVKLCLPGYPSTASCAQPGCKIQRPVKITDPRHGVKNPQLQSSCIGIVGTHPAPRFSAGRPIQSAACACGTPLRAKRFDDGPESRE